MKQAMLKAQFAAMESALAQAQMQRSWLTGQLNAATAIPPLHLPA